DARAVVVLASESPYPGISVRAPALDEDDVRKPTAFPHTRATADRGLPLVAPTIGGVLFEELAVRRNTKTLRADGVRAMGSLGREGIGDGPDLRAPEQRPIEDDLDEDLRVLADGRFAFFGEHHGESPVRQLHGALVGGTQHFALPGRRPELHFDVVLPRERFAVAALEHAGVGERPFARARFRRGTACEERHGDEPEQPERERSRARGGTPAQRKTRGRWVRRAGHGRIHPVKQITSSSTRLQRVGALSKPWLTRRAGVRGASETLVPTKPPTSTAGPHSPPLQTGVRPAHASSSTHAPPSQRCGIPSRHSRLPSSHAPETVSSSIVS